MLDVRHSDVTPILDDEKRIDSSIADGTAAERTMESGRDSGG
jgi:hypothetical protein